MPKDNLRDKLEGNELDLSLNNLSTVPVKELSAIPKGTKLDLSCNLLVNLPDNFGTLVHLVKIDFSKNQLAELPDNFGDLRNLQHLDLLGNQLTILPISFHKLTKLKWLDLKDNPLKDDLKHAAGDCLDEAQCKQCAQNVLKYMKAIHNELERRRQRKLLREREEEDLRRALEESEMERVRQERKNKKKNNKGNKVPKPATTVPTEEKSDKQTVNGGKHQEKVKIQAKKSSGLSLAWIWLSLLILLASLCGSSYFCEQNENNYICSSYVNPAVQQSWKGYEHAKNTISNIYEGVKSSRNKNTSTEDESLPKQKKNTDKPISEKNKDFTSETGNQQKAKPNMQ